MNIDLLEDALDSLRRADSEASIDTDGEARQQLVNSIRALENCLEIIDPNHIH